MRATSKDMRYHLSSVMKAVERGETVFITHRGKIKARIIKETEKTVDQSRLGESNPFIGMWKDRDDMKDVNAWVRDIRKGRHFDR